MSKFKVGDRVAVYGVIVMAGTPGPSVEGMRGTITASESGRLTIEAYKPHNIVIQAHPKQCRRLRRIEKPEVFEDTCRLGCVATEEWLQFLLRNEGKLVKTRIEVLE